MSGEIIRVWGTPKVLEANGATTIANSALVKASANYEVVADGASYPHGDVLLAVTFAVAPTEGATIALYAQPLSSDGTADADAPETTRPGVYLGAFVVNNVTTRQYLRLQLRDLPRRAAYWLHNNGTGQAVSAGWTLQITPSSYKPAP